MKRWHDHRAAAVASFPRSGRRLTHSHLATAITFKLVFHGSVPRNPPELGLQDAMETASVRHREASDLNHPCYSGLLCSQSEHLNESLKIRCHDNPPVLLPVRRPPQPDYSRLERILAVVQQN